MTDDHGRKLAVEKQKPGSSLGGTAGRREPGRHLCHLGRERSQNDSEWWRSGGVWVEEKARVRKGSGM